MSGSDGAGVRGVRESLEPSARWCMFWLFIATYGLSVAMAVRASSERFWLAYLPLALLTLAACGVAATAWRARNAGAGKPSTLLAWLDLPH